MADNLSFGLSFVAGFLSVLSPCVLPLLPSYVSYITGISYDHLTRSATPKYIFKQTFFHSLFFILGFSCIFILLGATASLVGIFLKIYHVWLAKIGGIIIVFFGLHVSGIFPISFLSQDKKLDLKSRPAGLIGSFIVGIIFAAAWTPCVGPILGSILMLASTKDSVSSGVLLLTSYSLGFALPFLVFSLFLNSFIFHFQKLRQHVRWVSIISGVLLIFLGLTLITGHFARLASYLAKFNLLRF
ncbi:MAG TPA: cytochrome c biogenesis protein CcdA [Bdellovibrionota bacterium]|nr:cytochrome c biogenesis protein CcdA [Bdellovibrionota bacterium]